MATGLPGPVPLPSWQRTRPLGPPVQRGGPGATSERMAAPRRSRLSGVKEKREKGVRGSYWSLPLVAQSRPNDGHRSVEICVIIARRILSVGIGRSRLCGISS